MAHLVRLPSGRFLNLDMVFGAYRVPKPECRQVFVYSASGGDRTLFEDDDADVLLTYLNRYSVNLTSGENG